MVQRRVPGLMVLVLLNFVVHDFGIAQSGGTRMVRKVPAMSFVVMIGITNPQGHAGLREFWLNGPGGSAEFRIHLGSVFSIGGGGDLSLLYFHETAFADRWPDVPLPAKQNLFVGNVYVDAAYVPFPASLIRPVIKGHAGAAFVTEAVYRQSIAGVRYTYYSIGGKTRLSLGLATGVSFTLNNNFSILLEVKGTYVHDDPAVGLLVYGRGGIQYKF